MVTIEHLTYKGDIMEKYKDHQPTCFDRKGAFIPERHEWYLVPVSRTRGSGPLSESNFHVALEILGGERQNIVEVHRFGHWGPGWYEVIIVNAQAGKTFKKAESIESALDNYPVLDDEDFSHRETDEANEIWRSCYSWEDRINYIRNNPDECCPHSFADLLSCVRGDYFIGYASNIIG